MRTNQLSKINKTINSSQYEERCRAPDCQWRGRPFRNLGNFFTPHLPVYFGRDTKSRWSLLSGVYARGSKRSHTRGKCVTCNGFPNSREGQLLLLLRNAPVGVLHYKRSESESESEVKRQNPFAVDFRETLSPYNIYIFKTIMTIILWNIWFRNKTHFRHPSIICLCNDVHW